MPKMFVRAIDPNGRRCRVIRDYPDLHDTLLEGDQNAEEEEAKYFTERGDPLTKIANDKLLSEDGRIYTLA